MTRTEKWLLGGLVLLLALSKRRDGVAWGDGWHFPVPDLRLPDPAGHIVEFPAVVTSGFKPPDRPNHFGCDIMYQATTSKPLPANLPAVDPTSGFHNVSKGRYFAPPGTPILAARDGNVWSVFKSQDYGIGIVIDHGAPWATWYQHLERTPLPPHTAGKNVATGKPTRVAAGDVIGYMGAAPADGEKLRHLHFEAWWKGHGNGAAQDPEPVMPSWGRSVWTWP